jgi:hypothetical protein
MRFIARRYDKVLTQPRCPDNSCVRSSFSIHALELYNDFPKMGLASNSESPGAMEDGAQTREGRTTCFSRLSVDISVD